MARFQARNGTIHFAHRGARANPRVLFVHGLGCQMLHWPRSLIDGVVDAGFCAITFDNRDAGLSHGCDAAPPTLEQLLAASADADALDPPYTLSDMAADAVALLDHLGQAGAHVIGVSMGGMIGQRMAVEHAERVYSLISIMSSTGNPALPGPTPDAVAALMASMGSESAIDAIENALRAARVLGGPHYASEEVGMARFTRQAVERAYRPDGVARQLAAILADGDRREALAGVRAASLVIHGNADPLVPVEAGRDTAAAIPGAKYLEIDKLGHDLPEPVIGEMLGAITEHLLAVEVNR